MAIIESFIQSGQDFLGKKMQSQVRSPTLYAQLFSKSATDAGVHVLQLLDVVGAAAATTTTRSSSSSSLPISLKKPNHH